MWTVALLVTVAGLTTITPGNVRLYSEADCDRFGEIWEQVYRERGGEGTTDHLCVEVEVPGVDV